MKNILVLLDAGHGIDTPGKESPLWPDGRKMEEGVFNRELCRLISARLTALNIEWVQLNHPKEDTPIGTRVRAANELNKKRKGRSFLISVHGNAALKPNTGSGWEAFVSPNASKRSKILADLLCAEAAELLPDKFPIRKGVNTIYKTLNLQILRTSDMPAVLTENLFFDNFKDFEFMDSSRGKEILAEIHVNAILKFIKQWEII